MSQPSGVAGVLPPDLPPSHVRLFAYACARRLQPVVELCASAGTSDLYAAGLALLRTDVGAAAPPAGAEGLVDALAAAPEQDGESSDEKDYWAWKCVVALTNALREPLPDAPVQRAVGAGLLALVVHADLDYLCEGDEGGAGPGTWERAEEAAQREAAEALTARRGDAEGAFAVLEDAAGAHAARLAAVFPDVVEELA